MRNNRAVFNDGFTGCLSRDFEFIIAHEHRFSLLNSISRSRKKWIPYESQVMKEGFLYIAIGERFLDEARRSARSVKKASPSAAICIITDQEIAADEDFDVVMDAAPRQQAREIYKPHDRGPYYKKIYPLLNSPFEKTIFLDSDTWVVEPLDDLFKLLETFDLLVTPDPTPYNYRFEKDEEPFSLIPAAFGVFNTGLIAYRKGEPATRFLEGWQRNYEDHVARFTVMDQPAFRLTLFESDIRFHVLPSCYNTISWVPFIIPSGGSVIMLHGRNPWLQRWAHHFKAPAVTAVGSLSLKPLLIYHFARVCYFVQRRLQGFRRMGRKA